MKTLRIIDVILIAVGVSVAASSITAIAVSNYITSNSITIIRDEAQKLTQVGGNTKPKDEQEQAIQGLAKAEKRVALSEQRLRLISWAQMLCVLGMLIMVVGLIRSIRLMRCGTTTT